MRFLRIVGGLLLLLSLGSAWAERTFPTVAKRGGASIGVHPDIAIDGHARRLSIGSRIWDQENRILLPSTVIGVQAVVNYTVDLNGEIDRIWFLTGEEAAQSPEAQKISR